MALLVSVVIPTFNNASLLGETLDGVRRQSFKDLEVIVIDDGSTDNTAEVVKSYDPEIIYCYQLNRGPAAARNNGVSLARGEYIAFCDHDDVWNERHLEGLLSCFSSHPITALAFDNAQYFGGGDKAPKLHLKPEASRSLVNGRVSPKVLLWQYPVASMSAVMFKKAVFEKLGGLNEGIVALDDLHFYLRLAAREEVRYVDYVGCKKRVSNRNLSQQINIKETNVQYLEDLWQNHPEVISAIGPLSFRLRLARKYFKLGRYYLQNNEPNLAKRMFWNAYKTNFINFRYLWRSVVKWRAKALQAKVRSLGAKYCCPVCDYHVKAFQPLPEFYVDNLQKYGFPFEAEDAETCNHQGFLCPSCQATDRDRLYALYLQDYLMGLKSDGVIKIVDFAPSAPLSHFIRKLIALPGQDISYRTADACAEGVDDRVDVTEMRIYEDSQFDFFICSHVLEHVSDDRKALRELYRILKPGGKGILMVPIVLSLGEIDEDPTVLDEGERWRRFGQFDHVRLYSKNGFVERVREAGFLVYQYGREFFSEELLTRTGITSQSVLYVVEK